MSSNETDDSDTEIEAHNPSSNPHAVDVTIYDMTGFQRDLLLAIANIEHSNQKPYGLAIKRELENMYAEDINHGRLYPNLNSLKSMGLIDKGAIDDRTKSYKINDRGYWILQSHMERFEAILPTET